MTADPTSRRHTAPKRILVLDDEDPVRRILSLMLQRLGYEAVGVGDGGQALAAYSEARNAASPFAAVILDLTLADGQSGLTVLSELLAFDPEARVILASGYLRSVGGEAALPAGVRSTLPKPFRAEDIARAVNEALGPI